jgi:opacity protein-like surface antigen
LIFPVAFVAALAASSAFASAKNFEGFSVGLNANQVGPQYERSEGGPGYGGSVTVNEVTNFDLGLQLQYDFAIGDKFLFGLGGDVRSEQTHGNTVVIGNKFADAKITDSSSWYLAPGYVLSDKWLIYGKLAELNARLGKLKGVEFNGHGLGIGARYALSENWQLQAEFMRNSYKDKKFPSEYGGSVVNKLHSTALSFGVLYKF